MINIKFLLDKYDNSIICEAFEQLYNFYVVKEHNLSEMDKIAYIKELSEMLDDIKNNFQLIVGGK